MNIVHRFFGNTLLLSRTKSGLPAAWESGGGMRNTGYAMIVANADGRPKKPIYIRQRGPLSNDDHALFVVREGDVIVSAEHHRGDFDIRAYRIKAIRQEGDHFVADLETTHRYYRGEWDVEPTGALADAVDAAAEKAQTYHCRIPMYYVGDGDVAASAQG